MFARPLSTAGNRVALYMLNLQKAVLSISMAKPKTSLFALMAISNPQAVRSISWHWLIQLWGRQKASSATHSLSDSSPWSFVCLGASPKILDNFAFLVKMKPEQLTLTAPAGWTLARAGLGFLDQIGYSSNTPVPNRKARKGWECRR